MVISFRIQLIWTKIILYSPYFFLELKHAKKSVKQITREESVSFMWKKLVSSYQGYILSIVYLSINRIPWKIGELKELWVLKLSNNRIQGFVPVAKAGTDTIESLDHLHDSLSDFIPHEMVRLSILSTFSFIFTTCSINFIHGPFCVPFKGERKREGFAPFCDRLIRRLLWCFSFPNSRCSVFILDSENPQHRAWWMAQII